MKSFLCILICLSAGLPVMGQLCNGSLGDPIIHISFGANNPGPLKPGVTNLSYYSLDCPNDGQYTITHQTAGCFNHTWFTITGDHTGDPGGQFMLVNASVTPNDFYVDTVSGLCSNTSFEFAAWIMNVQVPSACNFNPSKPNLTFRIETTNGSILATYNTGDILPQGQPVWQQYGTYFTTPAGVSTVVLRITNNAPGGCGNDLGLDDITFRPCGPTVSALVRNSNTSSVQQCAGDTSSIVIDATSSNGFTGTRQQWQLSKDSGLTWTDIAGATGTSYRRSSTAAGVYLYRLAMADSLNFSSLQCRVASNTVSVTVNPVPVLVPKAYILGCTSQNMALVTAQGTGYSYQWSGPNQFSAQVYDPVLLQVQYRDSGMYIAQITTAEGCVKNDSFLVKVYPGVQAMVSPDTLVCAGTVAYLRAAGGTVYQWSPGRTLSDSTIANPIALPADSTVYRAVVFNSYGCSDTGYVQVAVWPNPVVSAGPDKTIFQGQSVQLEGSIIGQYQQLAWTPATALDNTQILMPMASPADSLTYTLSAYPGNGCPAVTDQVFVYVYKNIAVPNAFSPNGDGIHDVWTIPGLETYPDALTQVYTRSGQLVFEARGGGFSWDGTYKGRPVPVATYYYLIRLNVGKPPVSGWLQVLR